MAHKTHVNFIRLPVDNAYLKINAKLLTLQCQVPSNAFRCAHHASRISQLGPFSGIHMFSLTPLPIYSAVDPKDSSPRRPGFNYRPPIGRPIVTEMRKKSGQKKPKMLNFYFVS